ncbi:hypothetical protein F8B91_08045 [Aestuariivirga litoralis]|nr:hypothetical protein [Aestuariivirga litoralis]
MKLLGTVLALLGLVLGALSFVQPGRMAVYGIQLDTAVFLLVGGILAVGLGGVIDAFRVNAPRKQAETVGAPPPPSRVAVPAPVSSPQDNAKAGAFFNKKTPEAEALSAAEAAVASVAGISRDEADAALKGAGVQVTDTINALEQAKKDIIKSIGGMDAADAAEDDDRPGPEDHAEAAQSASGAEGLFVVEEKVIRGRAARVLSDDTIEAETDEGWMRFEDFDHLNEYLDSMEEQAG